MFSGKIQVDLCIIEDLVLRLRPEYNSFAGKEVLGLRRKVLGAEKKRIFRIYDYLVPCTLCFALRQVKAEPLGSGFFIRAYLEKRSRNCQLQTIASG